MVTQIDQVALVHSKAHLKEQLGGKNRQFGLFKPAVLPEETFVNLCHSSELKYRPIY